MSALTVGKRIRQLRLDKNLSLRKLAKAANMTPGNLSHIENDKTKNPSMESLDALAFELGTTLDFLYYGEREIPVEWFEELPEELQKFVKDNQERFDIQKQDIMDLMGIRYRGRRPETSEGWAYIYNSLKMVIEKRL